LSDTEEGLEPDTVLEYLTRLRLTTNLLPLMTSSFSSRDLRPHNRLGETNSSLWSQRVQNSLHDFMLVRWSGHDDEFGLRRTRERLSSCEFHSCVGVGEANDCGYNMLKNALGGWSYVSAVARWSVIPLLMLLAGISPEEAGERALFLATRLVDDFFVHIRALSHDVLSLNSTLWEEYAVNLLSIVRDFPLRKLKRKELVEL
jgi:hypothetical protein